jgi:hypothetical protein
MGRNFLLGNRKKIAKFSMRTFACRSTFLYAASSPVAIAGATPFILRKRLKAGGVVYGNYGAGRTS